MLRCLDEYTRRYRSAVVVYSCWTSILRTTAERVNIVQPHLHSKTYFYFAQHLDFMPEVINPANRIFIFHLNSFFRNLIRNGMWPTSIYNLGMGVAIFSTSLAGDWRVVQPVNRKLWQLADILRIRKGSWILFSFYHHHCHQFIPSPFILKNISLLPCWGKVWQLPQAK